MAKTCSDACVHCQPFNEEWCVCWHLRIKGSKVQMGRQCTVEKVNEERVKRTGNVPWHHMEKGEGD